jgi:hypothetical protein
MTMKEGERQVAPTLDGIRRDHTARYEYAARTIPAGSKVIDFACGVGYGSRILAEAGHTVLGFDVDPAALAYAREHYAHENIGFVLMDAAAPGPLPPMDVAVCFETVEHVKDPRPLLKALRGAAGQLVASVPNQDCFPYQGQEFHHRHYTKHEFSLLLRECGWAPVQWLGQADDESAVAEAVIGRTLVAVCEPCEAQVVVPPKPQKHIVILGMGPSVNSYLEIVKRMGGRSALCDEVWTINALGDVFACDLVFHMDDVRVQLARAEAAPESNIARMVDWLRTHRGRVITSRAHPDFPCLEEFPLAAALDSQPQGYFNSTAAYAVAYAILQDATKITIFGNDFTYPNAHHAEKGRACVEFWLGVAAERGIVLSLPMTTSLMDALEGPTEGRFYGYDTLDLKIRREEDGHIVIDRTERAAPPSAEEVEERYDHNRHPNAIVEASQT